MSGTGCAKHQHLTKISPHAAALTLGFSFSPQLEGASKSYNNCLNITEYPSKDGLAQLITYIRRQLKHTTYGRIHTNKKDAEISHFRFDRPNKNKKIYLVKTYSLAYLCSCAKHGGPVFSAVFGSTGSYYHLGC